MDTRAERIKKMLIIIDVNQTCLISYLQFIYYIFSLYLPLVYFYYRKIKIKNIILKYAEDIRVIKSNDANLIIKNNGINLLGLFIPYEYIIEFSSHSNIIHILLFAKFEIINETEIKFNLDFTKLRISFYTENINDAKTCIDEIKSNMYYYLQYHKWNRKLLDYF
jgi:hypothetical protein